MPVQNVILDADFVTDVGDFGATFTACVCHKLGFFNLVGMVCNTSASKVPGGMNAVAKWFGITGIEYGAWKGTSIDPTATAWLNDIYDNFPRDIGLAATVQDTTTAYRTALAACADGSVDIVTIGYMGPLSDLLDSPADGVSALTGVQLVAAKVRRVYSQGGRFPSGSGDWNFQGGVTANTTFTGYTANVVSKLPVPWYLIGAEMGTFVIGGTAGRPTTDIVYHAYNSAGFPGGRTAWDEQTVLACAQNNTDFLFTRGTYSINVANGASTFTPSGSGSHYYATKAQSDAWLQARINALVDADRTASPVLSSWGSAPSFLQVRKT
jgi:purine nucleosidase